MGGARKETEVEIKLNSLENHGSGLKKEKKRGFSVTLTRRYYENEEFRLLLKELQKRKGLRPITKAKRQDP